MELNLAKDLASQRALLFCGDQYLPVPVRKPYTRSYKKSKIDMLIPIVAVVVIGLIILEGVFRVLCLMPDRAMGVFDMLFGGGAT